MYIQNAAHERNHTPNSTVRKIAWCQQSWSETTLYPIYQYIRLNAIPRRCPVVVKFTCECWWGDEWNFTLCSWFHSYAAYCISNFWKSRMFSVKQPNRIIHSLGRSERRLSKTKLIIISPDNERLQPPSLYLLSNNAALICVYATLASLVVYPKSHWFKHSIRSRINPSLPD